MPTNDLIGHAKERLVWTFAALDLGFLADPADPFVAAGRLVTGLPGATAFEPQGIDFFPSAKKRAEQGDLGGGRGMLID
jgi:hypothetical protein